MLKPIALPIPSDQEVALTNGYEVVSQVKRFVGLRLASVPDEIVYIVRDRGGDILSRHSKKTNAWRVAADAARLENDLYAIEKRKNIIRPVNPTSTFWRNNASPTYFHLSCLDDTEVTNKTNTPIDVKVIRSNRLHDINLRLEIEKKCLPRGSEANLKMMREILGEVKPIAKQVNSVFSDDSVRSKLGCYKLADLLRIIRAFHFAEHLPTPSSPMKQVALKIQWLEQRKDYLIHQGQ